MRFLSLAAVLALGVLVAWPGGKAPADSKKGSSSPKPPTTNGIRPATGVRVPHWMGVYRPHANARVAPATVDFTFTFNTDVGKVRTVDPPPVYDEKGNVRKPTRDELDTFRGETDDDKRLRGYKSDLSELHVGDVVDVSLSQHKKDASKKDEEKKPEVTTAPADPQKKAPEDGQKSAADSQGNKEVKHDKWTVTGHLQGTVVKINKKSKDEKDPTVTVRVKTVAVVARYAHNPGTKHQVIKPEDAQGTFILAKQKQGGNAAAK
jgi:hypothetical protein